MAMEEGEDRLSSLPKEVLFHLISFLETKSAIRTCVLSRAYVNAWTFIKSLDFEYKTDDDDMNFEANVNNVLEMRDDTDLDRFRLSLHQSVSLEFMEICMSYAVEHNVQNLKIRAHTDRPMVLPRAMVESTSIVTLRLTNGVTNSLLLPKSLALPKLKFLQLKRFILSHRNYNGELLLGCPVVEVLVLSHCQMTRYSKLKIFEVNSFSLKRLVIKKWSSKWRCFKKHTIHVSAPNLVEFKLQGYMVRLNFKESNLSVAWFALHNPPPDEEFTSKREAAIAKSFFELLEQITHNIHRCLFLSFESLWVLQNSPNDKKIQSGHYKIVIFIAEETGLWYDSKVAGRILDKKFSHSSF